MQTDQTASRECASLCRAVLSPLDRLMALLERLDEQQLNWRPAAAEANSVFVLATHTLGSTEESVLGTVGGATIRRERDQEFLAHDTSTAALHERWTQLRARLESTILALSAVELDREVTHPRRGVMSGREVLLLVIQHASEHLGQAELTCDLVRAAGE